AERAARELDDLRRVVEELAQLPARVGALEASATRLDEVDAALDSLAAELTQLRELPAADALLAERLDALALDVGALAERLAPLDALPEAVAAAASRVAAVEGLQEDLGRLRAAVVALEERGAPDPALGERLARLADRVESLSIDALGPAAEAAVAGVVGRVDELAARQLVADERADTLRALLEDLQGAVAALGARDAHTPELDKGTRALEASLAELRLRLDGTAPASTVASLLVAVEELQVAVEPLRTLDGRFESVERRLAAAESRAGEAARASDGAIGAVKEQLDAMAERTEARLAAVLERLDALEPGAATAAADDAGGDLRGEVAALGTVVESLRQGLAREIERMEQAWAAEREALTERVAAAAAATTTGADERGAAPTSAPGVPDADVARLARELERLTDRVSEQERSLVEHFARRERALVERLGAGTDVGQRLAELTRRIEEVRVRVEKVSAGSAGGASGEDVAALKEALFARLERLASSVDWRFQRLEGGPAAAAERADLHTRMDELASLVATLAGGLAEAPADVRPTSDAVGVYLALVPSPSGHQLVEVSGAVPQAGERIVDPLGSGELHVVAVGTSPLPGDERPCAFVEPAEVGSAVAPEAPTAA
ncbi:MAG: hypothetical protein ACRC50_04600, partial [Gaiella sp.]